VVEGAKLGTGYEALTLSLPMTAFPSIFLPSNREDTLKVELQQAHNGSIIGTDMLRMISNKVYTPFYHCNNHHLLIPTRRIASLGRADESMLTMHSIH
jgi:hypothetical protein